MAREKFREAIQPILDDCDLTNEWFELRGPVLGKRWKLHMLGTRGGGARRARTFLDQLKTDEGEWRLFEATNTDDIKSKVYMAKDKNNYEIKLEVLTKKLARIVTDIRKEVGDHARIFADVHTGQVSRAQRNLTKVIVLSSRRSDIRVEVKPTAATEFNLDHEVLKQKLIGNARTAIEDEEPWS